MGIPVKKLPQNMKDEWYDVSIRNIKNFTLKCIFIEVTNFNFELHQE